MSGSLNVCGLVAARMASTRFPDKPLARIRGIPMIEHVYRRALLATELDAVWVATCDQVILDWAAAAGAQAVMTRGTHERATERIAEALEHVERLTGARVDIAVLVQGDEPMLVPEMLDELVRPMRAGGVPVANLVTAIEDDEEFRDPNAVKVVQDRAGDALYFSREPIPSATKYRGALPRWKQLGLIAFTREALLEYVALDPTPLEVVESVDMNRLLEHGRRIRLVPTAHRTLAVDTLADLERVERAMSADALVARYATEAERGR